MSRERFCERHQGRKRAEHRRYNRKRRSDPSRSDEFYGTAQWKRLRTWVLRREPYCRICHAEGRVRAAHEVDHIVPIRQGGAPLDPDNLQSLCATCHRQKTAKERA